MTCKQQKHYTSRERLLSIILSHRHKVAALGPQHSTYPTRHSGAAGLRGTGTSLRAHCCTRAFGTKEGDFSSRIYLPSATYLNLVNAEFFSAGLFSSCCQGGEALYLAVVQILILFIVWAQHRLCCRFHCCWCRLYTTATLNSARIFAVGVGVMLSIFQLLEPPFYATAR